MKRISTILIIIIVMMISVTIPSVSAQTTPNCENRDPLADLSSSKIRFHLDTTITATATVSNSSTSCSYEVGMASYQMFTNTDLVNQQLFDWVPSNPPSNINEVITYLGGAPNAIIVPPNGSVSLQVNIPSCAAQIDVFFDTSENNLIYGNDAARSAEFDIVPLILPYFESNEFGQFGNKYWPWGMQRLLKAAHTTLEFCAPPPPPPPPPTGIEGCTPGYWKNLEKHQDEWVNLSPTDLYSDVFGIGPAITLIDALNAGGGGDNALLRHSTAALLNANSQNVNYQYTAAEIIAWTQGAFGNNPEPLKDNFDDANNAGCPLN